jgi:hypothetical protein
MSRPRHAKRDQNQGQIVDELRSLGFYVLDVSQLAHLGFDLLVKGHHRKRLCPAWLAVEVKAEGGALTEREEEVAAELQMRYGDEAAYKVAYCAEDVAEWFGAV